MKGLGGLQARRLMKASRIEVTSVEQELGEEEDGTSADPDSMLRTVELYRQQQRQQQEAAGACPCLCILSCLDTRQ